LAQVLAVVLSLGSNLGDRAENMAHMRRRVTETLVLPVRFSRLMETEPVGVEPGQQWFLNQLATGGFAGSPRELLEACHEIENELGRTRTRKWAPRTADVDILLMGGERSDESDLVIPHPQLTKRRFCLEGLVEIAPGFVVPREGRTAVELHGLMGDDVKRQAVTYLS
jgi:2-amino-4-hydroxy-6-hydroxymethyldihydropteridine diphosphokinase